MDSASAPKLAPSPKDGWLMAPYKNNFNTTLVGIVFSVVHNSMGQTLTYETTTLNMTAGQTLTAYLPVYVFIPHGNYTISVFATSVGGVAISNSTWVSVSLSGG
jgi:hypothetical protein